MECKKKTNRKAIIIANGSIKYPEKIKRLLLSEYSSIKKTMVIAVDGGLSNTLNMGFKPDVVIGDMDSIGKQEKIKIRQSGVSYKSTPQEKDESDTQLAVEYAISQGISTIIIAGATGGRVDHTFANIMLLAAPELKNVNAVIITDDSEIFVMNCSGSIEGKAGKLISIFSLTSYTFFLKTTGLKYPLEDEKLYFSPVRGLSNVFTEDKAEIIIKEGHLLVIKEI